ncbi:MAG: VWA domain-containing protein, partial [Verrucomicrobiales bacterium]|nr:VWA domain-containing protein [Verrucomicrobiales bacterium]
MTFAHPSVLVLALVLAPALAVAFWASWRVRKRLITRFVPRRLQETLTLGVSPRRAAFRAALLVVGVFFLLVALARPRLGAGTVEVNQRGLDILVGIDTSRSMLAEDAGPGISRLQRAKLAALDLARLARNDRLGLIAFAGSAFLQCPLTIDFEAFRQNIETLDTAVVQQGGTSIGPAIHAAIEAVSDEKENVRVLVLFTDGEDHDSGAVEAARRAATKGLRVFTVGVGTAQGEIIRLRDANGGLTYLKDAQGNVVKSSLNETLLGAIATATGGFYLPLQGPRAMSELFTRAIEPLPKATYQARQMEQYLERFQYPLGFALLLLLWEALFPETARVGKRLRASRRPHPTLDPPTTNPAPAPAASSSAPGIAALLVVLGLVTLASPSTRASTSSALRSYRASEFADAQAEYERLAKSKPADPRLRFNAGAAAYKAGDLDAAARHFKDALASTDLRLQSDTFYNLGNTQFRLGEKIEDPKVRQKAWEQSIGAYEAAVQLAPGHTNAQHNLAYVRQRLEDLKQQQQQ